MVLQGNHETFKKYDIINKIDIKRNSLLWCSFLFQHSHFPAFSDSIGHKITCLLFEGGRQDRGDSYFVEDRTLAQGHYKFLPFLQKERKKKRKQLIFLKPTF